MSREPESKTESRGVIWWDLISFALFLALAYYLKWETRDLVWSLWLGSLVIGYLTLVSVIGAGLYREKLPDEGRKIGGVFGALRLLLFFTFHFGLFHFVHSLILREFFPLQEIIGGDPVARPTEEPSLSGFGIMIIHLLKNYGLFLIPALISQRSDVWQAWKGLRPARLLGGEDSIAPFPMKKKDYMAAPYKTVIKMHILIFILAFIHKFALDSFLVYAIVYTFYFFPWKYIQKKED